MMGSTVLCHSLSLYSHSNLLWYCRNYVCREFYSIVYRHLDLRYVQAGTNECNRGLLTMLFPVLSAGITALDLRTLRWGFFRSTERGAPLLTVFGLKGQINLLWLKRSNKTLHLQVFKLLTSWLKGHAYTNWAQWYKKICVRNLQMHQGVTVPNYPFAPNEEYPNGVPFRCSTLGHIHGLTHKLLTKL